MMETRPNLLTHRETAEHLTVPGGCDNSAMAVPTTTMATTPSTLTAVEPADVRAAGVRHGYTQGWSFTPLSGKRPIRRGWQAAARESLEEALGWAARGNVGLRTGQVSRVVVIDADEGADLQGLELPPTVTAVTGGNGLHMYYTCSVPLGNSAGRLGPHIDVKADGGQVVFPGSVHPDTGLLYRWDSGSSPWDVPLAELPEHIIDLLKAPVANKAASSESAVAKLVSSGPASDGSVSPTTMPAGKLEPGNSAITRSAAVSTRLVPTLPPRPPLSHSTLPRPSSCSSVRPGKAFLQRYATRALQSERNELHQSQEGSRNDTLNRSSFSLGTLIGAGLLERGEVEQSLLEAAVKIGLSSQEAAATIRSGIESGMKHPRQVSTRDGVSRDDAVQASREDMARMAGADNAETPSSRSPHLSSHTSSFSHLPSLQDIPALPPGRFGLDLSGNADRFMYLFGQDVHWCDERSKWYVWDGRRWKTDAIRDVHRLAELTMWALAREGVGDIEAMKWAVRCNKDAKPSREMLDAVKHRSAITLDSLDRQPWLLGVDNGVVDLKTGELLPHDRAHLITTLSPAQYDANAPCPRWEKFLLEIMAGNAEMVAALQRLAGYFLTGDVSVQILPIFYGPGGNGKNVFLDTIMGIMGPLAEEAPEGLVTAKTSDEHPTEIADLYGKRLIVASETEENKKLRMGLVKKITGNKFLKGRFMRQDYFQFERTHKTVLVTNNKPVVTESSNAIWRRLQLIPFVVTIPEERQDRRLTERLVAEWPGILAWAVRGCLDWQARSRALDFPEAVREATDEYRNDSDHIADFLAECCEDWRQHPQQQMRTPKERVYMAYCTWCRNIGEDVMIRNAFNSRLRSQGFADKALRTNEGAQKCWEHLTLKGNSHD